MVPATRQTLMARLAALGIATSTRDHPPVATVEAGLAHWADLPGVHCKNLFLRDAGKRHWLLTCPIGRRVDLKALPDKIGSRRLSFGSPERLWEALAITPGSVTPFALINDPERRVVPVLDAWMMAQAAINVHPLENTATTTLAPAGLRAFLADTGHEAVEVDLGGAEGLDPPA